MPASKSVTLLNTAETAELLGLRPNTLELWRVAGRGPTYKKVGRAVRYVEVEVLKWLEDQTRSSTSQSVRREHLPHVNVGGQA